MSILHAAYYDASGEADGYPVMTVGGAVAPVKKWERFQRDWLRVLKDDHVNEFHATDFAASRGEFVDWKDDKPRRSKFLFNLGQVIKNNVNKLFMVNVEIQAWNEVNREYMLQEVFQGPYALAGYTAIRQLLKWAHGKNVSIPRLKVIFEDGDEGWHGLKILAKRSNVEPLRLSKSIAVPCQAADMIAWKSRIAFTNALRRLNKLETATYADFENFRGIVDEWSSLEKALVRPGSPGVYGREALIKSCQQSGVFTRAQWAKIVQQLPVKAR